MNSLLASNINGGFNNQQVANGSSAAVLSASIDFTVTDMMTNYSSSQQGKSLIKLNDTEDILYNGQSKIKSYDQNKNTIENHITVNGNNKDKSSEDTIPVPKVQLFTGRIHTEWNQVYKIGAGLINLGNTCFMNTVFQCLTYCPPLANYLLHDNDHPSKCTITGFCMMCLLQRHMKRVIGKTGEVYKPVEIYQRLRTIAKHFQYGRQEDAHECLRYVIDHLWRSSLTQVNGLKLDSATKETTVINKIFGGYHRSQVICLRCKKKSNTFDHFMDFILDIKQNVLSLGKALEKFIQPELLQNENSYKCPKCKMKVEAQKRFSVFQAPVVATFQLKRFDYNRSFGGKITKPISYPEKLNLRPYMSDPNGPAVFYRLNAVLVHSGASCNAGHYYCYVKNSNGIWYIMDDTRVQQVNLNQVLNQSAYVLFYIKEENSEKTPLKKCLDSKNTFMKGTISNSHFSKVDEVNVIKSMPLSDNISPFSNSKPYNSPNSVKKFNSFSSPNREKISFGFRNSASSTQLSSPKNKVTPPEPASVKQNGLVPYMEDSSESSDASESCPSLNKSNNITNTSIKLPKSSVDSYKSSTPIEVKAKLSKSVYSSPFNTVNNTPHKVSATDSWIVTDAPLTPLSSSSSVSSTTDWHVIEVSDLALNSSSTVKENKINCIKEPSSPFKESKNVIKESLKENKSSIVKDSLGSSKISTSEMSLSRLSESVIGDSHDLFSGVKMSNGHGSSPSAGNCNFRKQVPQNKFFPDDEETSDSFKRKHCDFSPKNSKDFPLSEHSESKYSPSPKKVKYTENSSFLNIESGVRNPETKNRDNSSISSAVQQMQYTSNCDNNSRTCLVNGNSNFDDHARVSLSKNSNGSPMESNIHNPEKDRLISRGYQGKSSEYSNNYSYERDKLPNSDKVNNKFLFGTEVPTWREESHYRPSLNSGHEVRRSFDNYDHEFDRGRVRRSKNKGRGRYNNFHQKNSFQKYEDRYHDKYNHNNRKYYNNGHENFRRYHPRHNNWKSNRNNYRGYHHNQQYHRY